MRAPSKCGTYGGAQRHRKAGETPCAACRKAAAAYARQYRAQQPADYANDKANQAARDRALRKLGARYPDELRALYQEERKR